jgi:hypothetical protein
MGLADIKAKARELEELMKAEGKSIVLEAAKQFFEACPEVEAVRWTQYAPHFNDGEPCEFGVNTPKVKYGETGGDDEDGWLDTYDDEFPKNADEPIRVFDKIICDGDLEDMMRFAFGPDCEVTITRDGEVTVDDEVDHD